jgi:hypothetical protein
VLWSAPQSWRYVGDGRQELLPATRGLVARSSSLGSVLKAATRRRGNSGNSPWPRRAAADGPPPGGQSSPACGLAGSAGPAHPDSGRACRSPCRRLVLWSPPESWRYVGDGVGTSGLKQQGLPIARDGPPSSGATTSARPGRCCAVAGRRPDGSACFHPNQSLSASPKTGCGAILFAVYGCSSCGLRKHGAHSVEEGATSGGSRGVGS